MKLNVEIKENMELVCPICGKVNTVKEWNNLSKKACTNRQMKRAYKELTSVKVYLHTSESYYQCPSCKRWSCGKYLKFETTNEELKKLGGEDYFKTLKHNRDIEA